MFTWLNKQGVQSDEGFVVQRTGRFTCEYREGERVIEVEVESGFVENRPCLNIRRDAFARWTSPTNDDDVSLEQQARMLRNFKAAMEFQGLALVVY